MKLRKLIASVCLTVGLLAPGFASPATAAAAPSVPAASHKAASVTKITSKPSTVTRKATFTVKGKVSPARKGTYVELQRHVAGQWVKIGSAKTTSSGAFSIKGKVAGSSFSATLRVASKVTVHYAAAASKTFKMGIKSNQVVKITSKPSTVTAKAKFAVKGKVSPARKGSYVELQRRTSKGKWVKIGSAHTTSSGKFTVKGKVSYSGSNVALRVRSKSTSKYNADASSTFKVDSISSKALKAVKKAKAQVGDAYRYGATGPSAFDCSGLTQYAYKSAGVKLSHSAKSQAKKGKKVSKKNLQPGDLVFFYSPVSHVGMYIGNGKIVHAANRKDGVEVGKLSWMPYSGARRVA